METIYGLCILYVVLIILFVLNDIVKTVVSQFKGGNYQWYTIKVLKEKREWWKWVICVSAFAVGFYFFIPISVTGEADFRAKREKPEYTAYYKCEYSIENFGSGDGYISIRREDGVLYADYLFTNDGKLHLGLELDDDNEDRSYIRGSIATDYYADIDIGEGPLERNSLDLKYWDIQLSQDPVECYNCYQIIDSEFAYSRDDRSFCPNCVRDEFDALLDGEVLRCVICKSYYFPLDSFGYGLCWDCSLEHLTGCSFCGQYTFTWYNEDGFSLCPECAGELYSDEGIQQAIETWLES